MAGGQLEAVYRQGALMAAFVLRAHFLIAWNPFSYDIEIGITVRAEFAKQTFLGTIRIGTTLGAQVRIWGPEFAGTARVNWSVFTFDVEFGAIDAAPPARTPLTWGEFRAAYLPADDAMCEIQIASGLRSIPDGTSDWVVDAGSLVVATRCAIPSSTVDLVDGDRAEQPIDDDPPPRDALLGIHPMGVSTFHSVHRVALRRLGSRGGHVDLVDNWRHGRALRQAVPKELWSPEPVAQGPSADVLRDRIVGLSDLRPDPQLSDDGPDAFPLSWFASQWDGRVRRVDMIASLPGQRPERPTNMFTRIGDTITSETVNADRLAAIERIRLHGFLAGEPADPVDPQLLAADVGNIFAVSPMLGGETGADPPADLLGGPSMVTHDVRVAERPRSIALPVPDVVARLLVELLAEFVERRYVDSGGAPSDGTTSIASIVTPADRPVALISDEVPQASLERALGAGTSAVFDLSRTGEEHARSYSELPTARLELGDDDELAARVITIDRAGRVADQAVTGTVVELSGTGQRAIARVIVSAHTPRAAGAANGWHGSSSLLRVAPRILVADGATVEVQTEDRHEVAAVRGAAAMRTNRVRTRSDGSDAPGWVKTTVPASAGTLAVYVRHDPGATGNGDARSAVVVEVTDEHGQVLRLVPAHAVHERADEVALLYRVPDSVRALSDTATYRTSLPAGPWVLDGIIAHDAEPQRVREAWQPGVTGLSPPPEPSAETRAVRLVRGAIAA
jgi:hypothetical protein